MQDDPPEDDADEFDGMLDDVPSTGPHMPEEQKGPQRINAVVLITVRSGALVQSQ